MPNFQCDCCSACCNGHLIVEVYDLDVLREPKLATAGIRDWAALLTRKELMAELEQEGKCLTIACGEDRPCVFLRQDGRCSIYPTRPNACVAMQAGDDQCQQARCAVGLPPLEPVDDAQSTLPPETL